MEPKGTHDSDVRAYETTDTVKRSEGSLNYMLAYVVGAATHLGAVSDHAFSGRVNDGSFIVEHNTA